MTNVWGIEPERTESRVGGEISSLYWCSLGFISCLFIQWSIFMTIMLECSPPRNCLLLGYVIFGQEIIHFSHSNFCAAVRSTLTILPLYV